MTCKTLDDVRDNIDRLDVKIVALLAERSRYVTEAARFKQEKKDVVVPERIEQIILRVRHLAMEHNADPDLLEKIYRSMIDAFIVHEAKIWQKLHVEE